ncbi:MAG: hypothetical protein J5659_03690 [Clostridia bacterium]|nr:hypothetical protein [Clostridia bacterium]
MSGIMRLTAIVLSVLMLALCFTAVVAVFHLHSGDCTGDDCPVCAAVSFNKGVSGMLSILFACILMAKLLFEVKGFGAVNGEPVRVTPVLLKVKMID